MEPNWRLVSEAKWQKTHINIPHSFTQTLFTLSLSLSHTHSRTDTQREREREIRVYEWVREREYDTEKETLWVSQRERERERQTGVAEQAEEAAAKGSSSAERSFHITRALRLCWLTKGSTWWTCRYCMVSAWLVHENSYFVVKTKISFGVIH